jgi:hypothetical protein
MGIKENILVNGKCEKNERKKKHERQEHRTTKGKKVGKSYEVKFTKGDNEGKKVARKN